MKKWNAKDCNYISKTCIDEDGFYLLALRIFILTALIKNKVISFFFQKRATTLANFVVVEMNM